MQFFAILALAPLAFTGVFGSPASPSPTPTPTPSSSSTPTSETVPTITSSTSLKAALVKSEVLTRSAEPCSCDPGRCAKPFANGVAEICECKYARDWACHKKNTACPSPSYTCANPAGAYTTLAA